MSHWGIGEILVILVAALVLFGPKRLPEIGKALGNGFREFRQSFGAVNQAAEAARNELDFTRPAAPAPAAAPTETQPPVHASLQSQPSAPVRAEGQPATAPSSAVQTAAAAPTVPPPAAEPVSPSADSAETRT